MEAHEKGLVINIISNNKTLLRIPVYQRNYSWNEEQCKILLDDVEKIMTSGREHFFGTMVYVNLDSSERSENLDSEYIIIDGQQRITTIIILLKALYDSAKERGDENICYDINDILYNRYCPDDYRIKLKSSNSDFAQFEALLNNNREFLNESGRIFQNYNICLSRVQEWLNNNYFFTKILAAIKKLKVVAIEMNKDDDQQAIFESLNSTGLNLSNADLIRNFLLMKESPSRQKILFDNWQVIERNLKADESDEDINNFFMHYITFISGSVKEINKKILYRRFVDLFDDRNLTRSEIISELKHLSGIYSAFVNKDSKKKYPAEIMKYLDDLRFLNQSTCYPFLLHVFNDYENGIIDSKTLAKTVKFILCYIVRRLICKVSSGSLRGFFAGLYSRVFKIPDNKRKYYESINKFISIQISNDALPSDERLKDYLLNQDIYGKNNALCKFILREIENGGTKECLVFDDLTIEHIMPQKLTPEWRRIFSPEEHTKYLHTLGNLTITGHNPELSNKSFLEKVRLIQEKAKAKILNSDVINKSTWTAEDIKSRAERLAKIVINLFSAEKINDPDIKFDDLTKITLDDFSTVTYKVLDSFVFDG